MVKFIMLLENIRIIIMHVQLVKVAICNDLYQSFIYTYSPSILLSVHFLADREVRGSPAGAGGVT